MTAPRPCCRGGGVAAPDPDAGVAAPSTPCADAGEAQLLAREFEYSILCGCDEEPWVEGEAGSKTCTIRAGMTVVWVFGGSEEHNAISDGVGDIDSPDKSGGRYSVTFDEAGENPYGCTIHPGDMSGYNIAVTE